MSPQLAKIFERWIPRIADISAIMEDNGIKALTPELVELWAGNLLADGLMVEFNFEDEWRNAQLLDYMVAYWRREQEEREERGFPLLPIWDFLNDMNASEYADIIPYSKYTLREARELPLPAVVDPLAAVITVAADRRSQIDNSRAMFYRWETARDSRVCGICKAHDGEIIGRSELIRESNEWELGCSTGDIHSTDIPPVHPRCRCKLVPVYI